MKSVDFKYAGGINEINKANSNTNITLDQIVKQFKYQNPDLETLSAILIKFPDF